MLARFWNDDEGAVISVELILILAILVFGIIPGLAALRNSIIAAYTNVGNAVASVVINVGVEDIAVGALTLGNNFISYALGFTLTNAQGVQLTTFAQPPVTNVYTLSNVPAAPPTGFVAFP